MNQKKPLKSYILNHKSNTPDAYKKGWIEFYKFRFKVTKDVLIPRPETELLVDAVLNNIKYYVEGIKGVRKKDILVLDAGTGSGNIAISISKNCPAAKIIGTDISDKAIKIAQLNAKFHQVEKRVTFIKSNLLSSQKIKPLIHNTYPLILIIVTNLPYIPTARIPYLDSSVKDFEPHIALDGGEDGFELYRKLFQQITEKKIKPKLIIGEIDYTHGELAFIEAQKYFPNAEIEVKKDLAHLQRILTIKLN